MEYAIRSLAPDRMDEALAMMQRFYHELELEFHAERAHRALENLKGWGGCWFIEVDGEVAGYFALTSGYSLEFGGRFALLDEFYMEPAYRGKGAGASVMSRIVEQARAMNVEALHLEADGPVMTFYERSGFTRRGREMMTQWLRP